MRQRSIFIVLLLFCFSLLAPAAYARSDLLEKITNRGTIIIGTSLSAPPFAFKNKEGKPAGFEVDLMHKLGHYMGVKVKIRDMAWSGLIPALLSKRIDIIGSRMSVTMERAKKVIFSHPWLLTGTFAIARKNVSASSWSDLNKPGVKVAAVTGSAGAKLVREKLPKAKLVTLSLDGDQRQALAQGRVDAAVNDEGIVSKFAKKMNDVKMLKGNMEPTVYAYALRANIGSYHLKNWLNLFFSHIMRTGEYSKIYKKWMGKPWEPSFNLSP